KQGLLPLGFPGVPPSAVPTGGAAPSVPLPPDSPPVPPVPPPIVPPVPPPIVPPVFPGAPPVLAPPVPPVAEPPAPPAAAGAPSELVVGCVELAVRHLLPHPLVGEVDEHLDRGVDEADLQGETGPAGQRVGDTSGDHGGEHAPAERLCKASSFGIHRVTFAIR